MAAAPTVDRDQVLAFRLSRHHLTARRPVRSLGRIAGVAGVRDSPPGSAAVAAQARLTGFTRDHLDRALDGKRLVQTWSMRTAAHLVPTKDLAVFTTGLLPRDDAGILAMMAGFRQQLARATLTPSEALSRVCGVVAEELDGRTLTKPELSSRVSRRVPEELAPYCSACRTTHISESLLRLVALCGVFCIAPREGNVAAFVRLDAWLGTVLRADPDDARVALLRRYLAGYGPSTAGGFAEWAGIAPAEAKATWAGVGDDLAEVRFGGRAAYLLRADVAALERAEPPAGLRLLPSHDPILQLPDRATLVPDPQARQRLWRAVANPGAVLHDGQVVASWRQRRDGAVLRLTLDPIGRLAAAVRDDAEEEAQPLAALRGCDRAEVTVG